MKRGSAKPGGGQPIEIRKEELDAILERAGTTSLAPADVETSNDTAKPAIKRQLKTGQRRGAETGLDYLFYDLPCKAASTLGRSFGLITCLPRLWPEGRRGGGYASCAGRT